MKKLSISAILLLIGSYQDQQVRATSLAAKDDENEWSLDIIHEDVPSRAITDVGYSLSQQKMKQQYATIDNKDLPPADQPAMLERVSSSSEDDARPATDSESAKKAEDPQTTFKQLIKDFKPDNNEAIEYKRIKTPQQMAEYVKEFENKKQKQIAQLANPGRTQSQEIKPRPNQDQQLIVHLVPFSKTNLGFKKTIDDTYSGTSRMVQPGYVENVLTSVVDALLANPERKFTFADVKYIQMWYSRQTQEMKDKLKTVVQNGQFEIASGGWSSTDEACPNFEDLIDNIMIGHEFLKKQLGVTPKIGWNLDAPGHSATNARLFAQLGMQAQFFAKIDQSLKDKMKNEHGLNFIWRPYSKHFGDQYQILTSVMKDDARFQGESGIDFDAQGTMGAFVDDKDRTDFNAPDRSVQFLNYVNELASISKEKHVLIPMGNYYAFQNAGQIFKNMERLVKYIEENYKEQNVDLVFSTPSEYVKAIREEKQSYPVFYGDLLPYIEPNSNEVWTGYFSSRPNVKKIIKDTSAIIHAQNKIFAQQVLRSDISDSEVADILKSKVGLLDILGIMNDFNHISGDQTELVYLDAGRRLEKALSSSNDLYKKAIQRKIKKQTGLNYNSNDLLFCKKGPSGGNDTFIDCPLDQNKDKKEFIVIVQNPQFKSQTSYAKVRLNDKNWKAQKLVNGKFIDVPSDILEQQHFTYDKKELMDYEMYLPSKFSANQLTVFKILKIEESERQKIDQLIDQSLTQKAKDEQDGKISPKSSLKVLGIGPSNDILFTYQNPAQKLKQTFGVNLRYYKGHAKLSDDDIKKLNVTDQSMIDKLKQDPEGVLTFKTDFRDPGSNQYSNSTLDGSNVVYQQGQFIEQYTITFQNKDKIKSDSMSEQAVIKVKFSPNMFEEIIQFEVELNSIPFLDDVSKDVTVNWKFYDGFDPKGEFWTDSNGLEMQERHIDREGMFTKNFYPIDSAIAMRDKNDSKIQVTIMNDRPQSGSADLSDKAMIEIVQQRRLSQVDPKNGYDNVLNDTDKDGAYNGIRVNAQYNMQIFDTVKGKSLQREQQLRTDQPLQYFFVFNQGIQEVKPAAAPVPVVGAPIAQETQEAQSAPAAVSVNQAVTSVASISSQSEADSEVSQETTQENASSTEASTETEQEQKSEESSPVNNVNNTSAAQQDGANYDEVIAELEDVDLDAPVPNKYLTMISEEDNELNGLKKTEKALDLAEGLKLNGISYQAYPLGKKRILVRFENILDRFDVSNSDTKYVDLIKFAQDFWKDAQSQSKQSPLSLAQTSEQATDSDQENALVESETNTDQEVEKPATLAVTSKAANTQGSQIPKPTIQEMSISGVQKLTELKQSQKGSDGKPLRWIGDDDKNVTRTSVWKQLKDKNGFKGIALEPMRIRSFVIDFDVQAQKKIEEEKLKEKQVEATKKAIEDKIIKQIEQSGAKVNASAPVTSTQDIVNAISGNKTLSNSNPCADAIKEAVREVTKEIVVEPEQEAPKQAVTPIAPTPVVKAPPKVSPVGNSTAPKVGKIKPIIINNGTHKIPAVAVNNGTHIVPATSINNGTHIIPASAIHNDKNLTKNQIDNPEEPVVEVNGTPQAAPILKPIQKQIVPSKNDSVVKSKLIPAAPIIVKKPEIVKPRVKPIIINNGTHDIPAFEVNNGTHKIKTTKINNGTHVIPASAVHNGTHINKNLSSSIIKPEDETSEQEVEEVSKPIIINNGTKKIPAIVNNGTKNIPTSSVSNATQDNKDLAKPQLKKKKKITLRLKPALIQQSEQ